MRSTRSIKVSVPIVEGPVTGPGVPFLMATSTRDGFTTKWFV
jgi:hypothetical protein